MVFTAPRAEFLISFFFFMVTFLSVTCGSGIANAQSKARVDGILINADDQSFDQDTGVMVLKGNVQAIFKNHSLKADSVIVRRKTKEVDATGNVSVITQQATVVGQRVVMNYDTQLGTIYDGYVESGPALFEGRIIYKIGENDYVAESADYTACSTCPPAWSFSGKTIKAELGGYAYIKNSFLRVGGIPVIWLPYLIVPLKSTRQSGLLTPEYETSSENGTTFSQSYFWAISRSQDATISAKNYEKRGLKTAVNYRYVLSESSYGDLDIAAIPDRAFAKEDRLNAFRSDKRQNDVTDRWYTKYNHYYELPGSYISRARLNFASDLQYPKDFTREMNVHGDPALDNRVSLTKNTDVLHWAIDSSYYTNLMQTNPMANNDNAVHRFPEIRVATSETKIFESDFLFNFNANYVNFARNSFGHDDIATTNNQRHLAYECRDKDGNIVPPDEKPNSIDWDKNPNCRPLYDGKFSNGDLIRTGQRVDIRPSISRPFKLGSYFDVVPRVTYRETHYHFNIGDTNVEQQEPSLTRRFLRTELSISTTLSSVYGDTTSPIATRYKHEIQPEISLNSIPWIENPKHVFWGGQNDTFYLGTETISDNTLNFDSLQFDYEDRIYNRDLVTIGVSNKVTERKWNSGKVDYQQIAFWSLSQNYDAHVAKKNPDRAWSTINSLLQLRLNNLESLTTVVYHPRQEVSIIASSVKIKDDRANFFEIGLSQTYDSINPEQKYVDHKNRTEDFIFGSGFNTKYIAFAGKLVYDANWKNRENLTRIKSWGYLMTLRPPGECWEIYLLQELPTGKENSEQKISFAFLFDGKTRTSVSNSMFDKTSN